MNKQLLSKVEKERVRDCKDVLESIVTLLEEKKDAAIKSAYEMNQQYNREWGMYQADRQGVIRTLDETINLLKVNKDD